MKATPTTLVLLAFTLLSATLSAQKVAFKYTYDNSGNRVKREVVVPEDQVQQAFAFSTVAVTAEQPSEDPLQVDIFETVRLYPNPTSSIAVLEIEGFEEGMQVDLVVSNLQGFVVMKKSITMRRTELNVSGYLNGTYIVQLVVGGKVGRWKLVKV